jgi:hypothetical protein
MYQSYISSPQSSFNVFRGSFIEMRHDGYRHGLSEGCIPRLDPSWLGHRTVAVLYKRYAMDSF